jgi:hypothetical protein
MARAVLRAAAGARRAPSFDMETIVKTLATAFNARTARNARSAGSLGFISAMTAMTLMSAVLFACSGGSTIGTIGDGGAGSRSSGGSSGTSGSSGKGGVTDVGSGNPASTVNPKGSAPGEVCHTPSDCLIVYCDCTNHSVVNSQRCVNSVCQTPQSACPGACSGFGTNWSGTSDLEKPRSSSAGTSGSSGTSSSSSGSSSTCASYADCAPYVCTCIDGQSISDQACFGGTCGDATTGCDASCMNTGHGGVQ